MSGSGIVSRADLKVSSSEYPSRDGDEEENPCNDDVGLIRMNRRLASVLDLSRVSSIRCYTYLQREDEIREKCESPDDEIKPNDSVELGTQSTFLRVACWRVRSC